jgi:RNA polymerase sigma-70 factor (ECF subfamily)
LLRFLLTRCASIADAEDALQDTFIAAYRYLHSYDPRWRFSTWLYRIAIRKAQKIRSENIVEYTDLSDEESDPLSHCIAASESENLWVSAKRVLNDDVFAATWLRYTEDMSISDISKALDRSESWTKVNLLRARKALETEMNQG